MSAIDTATGKKLLAEAAQKDPENPQVPLNEALQAAIHNKIPTDAEAKALLAEAKKDDPTNPVAALKAALQDAASKGSSQSQKGYSGTDPLGLNGSGASSNSDVQEAYGVLNIAFGSDATTSVIVALADAFVTAMEFQLQAGNQKAHDDKIDADMSFDDAKVQEKIADDNLAAARLTLIGACVGLVVTMLVGGAAARLKGLSGILGPLSFGINSFVTSVFDAISKISGPERSLQLDQVAAKFVEFMEKIMQSLSDDHKTQRDAMKDFKDAMLRAIQTIMQSINDEMTQVSRA